jgi:hypothetical protein
MSGNLSSLRECGTLVTVLYPNVTYHIVHSLVRQEVKQICFQKLHGVLQDLCCTLLAAFLYAT